MNTWNYTSISGVKSIWTTPIRNQELGGDYGIQRFVGNFGAIVFAPLGGYLIDATSPDPSRPNFSASVYIYLALKVVCQLGLEL